jgi:diguanylate cyclase (GGDEF)-like protein
MTTVESLLREEIRLPSPPAIAVRILDIVKQEDFSFKQLAAVIQSDPALLSRILRLANSGFYGLPKKVSSIDTAVAVLGVNALKNIALSFIISEAFSQHEDQRVDFDKFWRRSITTAVAAQIISDAVGCKNDDAFIVNLLQDIGVITSFVCRREEYFRVFDEKAASGRPLIVVEREMLGYDHQEVGAELLQRWGLPESIYLPIHYHHSPESAPRPLQTTCRIMRAADRLAGIYYGSDQVHSVRQVKEMMLTYFGVKEEQAAKLIDNVAGRSAQLQAEFEIDPDQIKPFSQILQEANQELSQLNMSYELLVIENAQAKNRAMRLAKELKVANDRLRELAYRDGLTNLFNHRYFLETMDRELARAARHERPLTLLMFDIDNFKEINDTYGHQVGDIVLKSISQILSRNNRKTDVVARYGGEEFVMVLPETNLAGALVKAEACRAAVASAEIKALDQVIHTTVSVGVAAWDSDQVLDKYRFIDLADQALYRSKQEGRNRVSS